MDAVSILASDNKKEQATKKAQAAVDIVNKWSKEWKLNLNADKSEVTFFTMASNEMSYKPDIVIGNTSIKVNLNPRLLGVHLDCKLSFNKHVEKITEKSVSKMRLLAAVSNSEWGWRKQDLRKIFIAHVRSVVDFVGSAWQPWLSKTQIKKLDIVQNKALMMITRQAKSSPLEGLRREAQVPSIQSVVKTTCAVSREKALRYPEDHPRRECRDANVLDRLNKRNNCRTMGINLTRPMANVNGNRRMFDFYTVLLRSKT